MPDAQRAEIAKLESLHADHPEGRIFTHLAEAYRKAGELDRAREVLAEGIERHPDYSSAHVVLARVLVDQGESAEAEAEFRRVLQLDSHNLVALRSLGDLARDAGRTDEALELYRRLLEVEPADEDVRAAIRDIEEGPAADGPAQAAEISLPRSDDQEEDSPWATDAEDAEPAAAEEEPWAVGGTGEEEEAFMEPAWSPGEEAGEPEPGLAEDAAVGDAAVEEGDAEEADVVYGAADAMAGPADDDFAAVPDVGEPGMLTETIAQVYARQGLYDRAAEVYRQLLRVRPDDAGLRTRMEEMEALAAGTGEPAEGEPEPGPEPGPTFAVEPEPEAESVVEPEPEPEPEPGAGVHGLEPEGPPPEVEPLPGLESSEPESVPHVAPLGGLETDEVDPETGLRTDEPSWQDWSESRPVEAGGEPAEHVAEHPTEEPEPGEDEAEAVESVWTGAEGASGAEESPYAWAEGEPEEDASEPIDVYLRSLLGWAGGAAPAIPDAGDAGDAEGTAADTAADTAEGPSEGPREATADRGEERDQGEGGEERKEGEDGESPDDDDLDTFRSWLESLKQ